MESLLYLPIPVFANSLSVRVVSNSRYTEIYVCVYLATDRNIPFVPKSVKYELLSIQITAHPLLIVCENDSCTFTHTISCKIIIGIRYMFDCFKSVLVSFESKPELNV